MKARFCCMTLGLLTLIASATTAQSVQPSLVEPIGVYVNGAPVEFMPREVLPPIDAQQRPVPALLVNGHAMLPVRFIHEVLGVHLDLHLSRWGITRLGNPDGPVYAFMPGDPIALTSAPMSGGEVEAPVDLSTAPRIIDGRLYVPVRPTLSLFGYTAAWDAGTHALYITRSNPRPGTASVSVKGTS